MCIAKLTIVVVVHAVLVVVVVVAAAARGGSNVGRRVPGAGSGGRRVHGQLWRRTRGAWTTTAAAAVHGAAGAWRGLSGERARPPAGEGGLRRRRRGGRAGLARRCGGTRLRVRGSAAGHAPPRRNRADTAQLADRDRSLHRVVVPSLRLLYAALACTTVVSVRVYRCPSLVHMLY